MKCLEKPREYEVYKVPNLPDFSITDGEGKVYTSFIFKKDSAKQLSITLESYRGADTWYVNRNLLTYWSTELKEALENKEIIAVKPGNYLVHMNVSDVLSLAEEEFITHFKLVEDYQSQ